MTPYSKTFYKEDLRCDRPGGHDQAKLLAPLIAWHRRYADHPVLATFSPDTKAAVLEFFASI